MAHSHSFKFCIKGSYQINCTSPKTVLQALQTSRHFNDLVKKQSFFIERETSSTNGVIAEHFPCHLVREGELLYIHIFDMNQQETDVEDDQDKGSASGELITFTVALMGGKDTKTKDIVRDKKNSKDFNILCVYAYSDDTIAEALKRDGRFADIVFDDRCKLYDLNDKTTLELNQNVRALKGHSLTFTEKSDTEQKELVKAESSTVGDTESESREKSTMTKSGKTKTHKKSSNMPDFGEIYGILRSQFPELVNPPKHPQMKQEEFVQSIRAFSRMCQLEKLVNLGTSVCTVKTANMQGTGFLLFDNFILTNAHVIEESYKSKKLTSAATVNFNMGSGTSLDREFPLSSEVFAVLKGRDDAGRYVDFALLKLQDREEIMKNEDISNLPRLLKEYTSNPHAGGICIIGHPGSEVKRMDVSCIVPHKTTRSASADSSIQVSLRFSPNNSEFKATGEESFNEKYNTCFLKGCSGSPVFDGDCKLVAMHNGGFFTEGRKEQIIEFGIPLHSIIQNIIKQLASRESLDVMLKFIETAAQNPHLEEYLKEYSKELMRNPSDGDAEMLARICLETKHSMPILSQMIQKSLDKNKEKQIQKKQ